MYRQELAALQRAVRGWAENGGDLGAVRTAASRLSAGSVGTDLRTHCLNFCQALTAHHSIEDGQIFPQLRRLGPHAGPIIDELSAQHRQVVPLMERLTRAAGQLTESPASASAAVAALDTLADRLTAHLDFEEARMVTLFNNDGA